MSEPIQAFGFNFAPRLWAQCDGQLLPIAQNQALFSLLGTQYGGDGRTTFGLPDLRGRLSLHQGNGPGLTDRRIGQKGGAEEVSLTAAQLASHNHGAKPGGATIDADQAAPTNNYPASVASNAYAGGTNTSMGAFTTENTGSGQGHNNMQPYLVINWCIALQGIFPPRN